MALSALNLNQLVALRGLLQDESVGGAARSMGVTQSAMSHTLRQLRELLDDPLLVRVGNTMVPTPYALEVLPRLQHALGDLEAIVSGRAAFNVSDVADTFTVAAADGPAGIIAGDLYEILASRAPKARLRIASVSYQTLHRDLLEGQVDVALVPPILPLDGLSRRGLSATEQDVTMAVVCRADHPRVRKRLTLAAFCELPHVMGSITGEGPSWVDDLLAGMGRQRVVAVRTAHMFTVPELLVNSDMLHVNVDIVTNLLCAHWPLASFPLPFDVQLPGDLLAVWHPRFDNEPASRFFRDAVVEAARASAKNLAG